MFPILALGLGLLLGWASGGTVHGLAESSWRWGWLAILLFIVQGVSRGRLLGLAGWSHIGMGAWVVTSVVLVIVLFREWRWPGTVIAGVGVVANLDVVLLNGAMPVALPPGGSYAAFDALAGAQKVFYHPVAGHTLGAFLGDVVPFGGADNWTMVSAGDVLLMVGVCVWVVDAMTRVVPAPHAYCNPNEESQFAGLIRSR